MRHYKDKDAILNVLTKDGLVPILGRGIFDQKKPLRIFTSPFIKANYEIYKGKVGGFKLKDGKILKFYNENYLDFNLLSTLDFISELTLKTIDGIDDFRALYNLVDSTLNKVVEHFDKLILVEYFLNILKLLGLKILIENFEDQIFMPTKGTFIFDDDINGVYFSVDEVILINNILNNKNDEYSLATVDADKILESLNKFLVSFTDVRLKSISLLI